MRSAHKVILAGVLMSMLAGAGWYSVNRQNDPASSSARHPPTASRGEPVKVAIASLSTVPVQITSVGHAQAVAFVNVHPQIDGIISRVMVQDGQEVKAGDILVELDSREQQAQLAMAQANLRKDQAQLTNASREVTRTQPLLQRKFATAEQMDLLHANRAALEASVAADQAAIDQAALQVSYATVRAPIDGRVGTINVKMGNLVHPNDQAAIMVINQIRPIYVAFPVTQSDFDALQRSMFKGKVAVQVTIPGSSMPPEEGEIAYTENAVDAATNTLPVRAVFPNMQEHLWPGQFLNVTVLLDRQENVVTVPDTAVQTGQQGMYVWIVKADSTVDLRPIQTGLSHDGRTVILKGLAQGEQVVTEGQFRLDIGTKVEVMDKVGAAL
ncbi:MAG TPA: efflux RND transporter periplasmic adaptor subunit [Dongiaceae bacterium]|jgi:multidrug efflux system membrane fusion protein|nr:efflux RND transporter periplasmic adaptor subunit [Dongiaceae bacterium]